MYGETTGEIDEFGLTVRRDWASENKGRAKFDFGHTPVQEASWVNGTICIDTGCVFGGKLTALRYPELELVSVDAKEIYYEPIRPLQSPIAERLSGPVDQLDIADVLGKQVIQTDLFGYVTIQEDNSAAALEIMTRFAVDPHWLIHLPPTMSPSQSSSQEGWLERPEEAFSYYGSRGVKQIVLEEKHMGSRALVVLSKSEEEAAKRFGVRDGSRGCIVTRTGRRFFNDLELEAEVLQRIDDAMKVSNLWAELETDWVLWDCEIMPWSMKAGALVRGQYASVGAAANAAASSGATTKPSTPFRTTSGIAPAAVTTLGRAMAMASSKAIGRPSAKEGRTKPCAPASHSILASATTGPKRRTRWATPSRSISC
jgi:protein phosphatase